MNMKMLTTVFTAAVVLGGLSGCAGTKSFTTAARAGDTVSLAVGWNVNAKRSNLAATITPFSGAPVVYAINNPNIRAVLNMYPDPMSRLIVGTETNQSLGFNANFHGAQLNSINLSDKDLAQTMVLLNLPAGIAAGPASIALTASGASLGAPITVEVLPGTGSANTFDGSIGSLTAEQLGTLERASGSVVNITGSTVPYAIYLEISHATGVGVPWLVNPRGDLKNISWTDTGTVIKVIITPSSGKALNQFAEFKFFVSGGVTGLAVSSVKAYDVNGNLIPGVLANIGSL